MFSSGFLRNGGWCTSVGMYVYLYTCFFCWYLQTVTYAWRSQKYLIMASFLRIRLWIDWLSLTLSLLQTSTKQLNHRIYPWRSRLIPGSPLVQLTLWLCKRHYIINVRICHWQDTNFKSTINSLLYKRTMPSEGRKPQKEMSPRSKTVLHVNGG